MIKDHVNLAVYTLASLPNVANAAPYGVKAIVALPEYNTYLPKQGDLIANNHKLPPHEAETYDGGMRDDKCDYWKAMRPTLLANAANVAAFYLDEPHLFLEYNGFTREEVNSLEKELSDLVKGNYTCPGMAENHTFQYTPFVVVEADGTESVQHPIEVDWVGFDCYGPPANCSGAGHSYVSLWNAQRDALRPTQKLVAVAPAFIEKPVADPSADPPLNDPTIAPQSSPQGPNVVTQQWEQDATAGRADFYLEQALSDNRCVALFLWHGPSRWKWPKEPKNSPIQAVYIGTLDMPTVWAKWRFLGRALGFGIP
jgi:hypothetical protein